MKITSISPSRYSCAEACDFKYYLTYEKGMGDQLSLCRFSAQFGTSVHAALEQYAGGNQEWEKVLLEETVKSNPYEGMEHASKKIKPLYFVDKNCHSCSYFDAPNNKCKIKDKNIDDFNGCPKILHEEAIKMVKYAQRTYGKLYTTGVKSNTNPSGKLIGIEYEFKLPIGKDDEGEDIILHGLIDLVSELDNETVEIIDYKTGFKTSSAEELMDDIQPMAYAAAARILFPQYKFFLLTFDYFRGKPITVTFNKEECDATIIKIINKWKEIKRKTILSRRKEDYYCKYLCNRPLCDAEWQKIKMEV